MRVVLVATLLFVSLAVAPGAARAQTTVDMIAGALDTFWAQQFADRGLTYSSPRVKEVSGPGMEFCDGFDVYYTPAGFCASNDTITYSDAFGTADDLSWLPIIAHEWGHHIQYLIDTGVTSVPEAEHQADCFAGAFIDYAQQSGDINPVIGTLSLQLTQAAGDIWWLAPGEPMEHGNGAERAIYFAQGLNGGLVACGI
jgi:predicted metalloprotease